MYYVYINEQYGIVHLTKAQAFPVAIDKGEIR